MITKKQWAIICHIVYDIRHLEPFIHGKRVTKVDLFNNTITTSLQGQPPTVYNFNSAKGKNYSTIARSIICTKVTLMDIDNARIIK